LSAFTGGVCVARAEGTARSPARRQIGPRSSLTLARTKQTLAQLTQKSPKAGIVRGALKSILFWLLG
jgi:hypothetical protein